MQNNGSFLAVFLTSIKITLVFLGFATLGGFSPHFAHASTFTEWQNMVSNSTTTGYWTFGEYAEHTLINTDYDIDLEGFLYWASSTTIFSLSDIELPNEAKWSGAVPLHSEGYRFWIIGSINSVNTYFRYDSGSSSYANICLELKNITLADKTLSLYRCAGAEISPITYIRTTNSWTQIYAMIYTDDDLNALISNEAQMRAYLASLSTYNEIFGGQGWDTPYTLPEGSCDDMGTFSGSLCKVFVFLFKPSATTLSNFSNLKATLELKPPFGYWTSMRTAFESLSATSTPAFALTEASTITDNVFTPVKTGLTWVLWLVFGIFVLKRVSSFDF